MNILYLVGNGFDLNLGLKTRYSQFLEYYLQQNNDDTESVIKLKKKINRYIENWSDLEKEIGKYTKEIIDIKELDEIYDSLTETLSEYLKEQEKKITYNENEKIRLAGYLSHPENSMPEAHKRDLIQTLGIRLNQQKYINIVSFNYTTTLETLLAFNKKQKEIILNTSPNKTFLKTVKHIHGLIGDGLILGVNDVSQISNEKLAKLLDAKELLVKSYAHKAIANYIDKEFDALIKNADLICMFGLSIGDTDKVWWELIGGKLKKNIKLIIFVKTNNINSLLKQKVGRIQRDWIKRFLDKTKLTENEKEEIRTNIYVCVNTDMFKLDINKITIKEANGKSKSNK